MMEPMKLEEIKITLPAKEPTLVITYPRKPESFEEASHWAIEALRAAETARKEVGDPDKEAAARAELETRITKGKEMLPVIEAGAIEVKVDDAAVAADSPKKK